MVERPLVSVIMPVYNSEASLQKAISSIVTQTYSNLEILIINDASSDHSQRIIDSFKDDRIKCFKIKVNEGTAYARNIGLKHSVGKYVAFIDSDDCWLKDKVTKQVELMEQNRLDLCYSYYDRISDNDEYLNTVSNLATKLNYQELLKSNSIPMLTAMVRKKIIAGITFPNQHHEDYLFWLHLFKSQSVTSELIKQVTANYHVHRDSVSGNKLKSLLWTWKIYRKQEKLSFLYSLKFMISYIYRGIRKRSSF